MKAWICNVLCNFYCPVLGTARIYAYARQQGQDVSLKDFNQNGYFSLLSRDYLEPAIEKTSLIIDMINRNRFLREDIGSILLHSSNNALRQLTAQGMLPNSSFPEVIKKHSVFNKPLLGIINSRIKPDNIIYALLSEKEYVLAEIEKSRKALDEHFFSLNTDDFLDNFHNLLGGKALIDMAYFPAQLDFGLGFNGTAANPQVGDILRGVEDEKFNYLIPYYRNEMVPLLDAEQPEVIGISITCIYELLPAFTLAHMIKKVAPQTHIVLGGSLATQLADRIARNRPLWDMFDSLIVGPGEVAFTELIEQIGKKATLSGVPNIIYKESGSIKYGEKTHDFDINDACTPEFVSVRPKSGLPLETTSGCYWGKCIFCYYPSTGSTGTDSTYGKKRVRAMEKVLDDIQTLKDRYDPLAIVFTDSSFHPKRLEAIAEANLRNGGGVKFSALFRLEKEFISKKFCRKLVEGGFLGGFVGLESGSQRVNDIINKGVDLKDAEIIMKNFYKTGILLHLFSIVGIPGETREDAMMTYRFFKRWHRYLKLDWVVYFLYLTEQSALARRADEFKLKPTPLPDTYLVPFMRYKQENGLSQEESVSLAINFTEKLRRFMHPLNYIMDIESMALFLLAQKAKGIPPEKVKKRR